MKIIGTKYSVLKLDGNSENRKFNLYKAFVYIEAVTNLISFLGKDLFSVICAQHVLRYHLI